MFFAISIALLIVLMVLLCIFSVPVAAGVSDGTEITQSDTKELPQAPTGPAPSLRRRSLDAAEEPLEAEEPSQAKGPLEAEPEGTEAPSQPAADNPSSQGGQAEPAGQEEEPYFPTTQEERALIYKVVAGESRGEPHIGQMAVAQCILNACEKDGLRPAEVIKKYQYYTGHRGAPTESVIKAVDAVFDDGEKAVDDVILWFYAPARCTSRWHERQRFVVEIGGHRFFGEWE